MIVISGALVLVALVLLVVGLVADTLAFVYASIGVTVLSLVLLGLAVVQRRGELLPGDVPGDDLLPGGLHADAARGGAVSEEQPRPDAPATSSALAVGDAPDTTAWEGDGDDDGDDDRPGGGDVLVVPGRARYHVEGCRYLSDHDAEVLDILDAREDGFTSCGVCRPDEALGVEPVLVRLREGFVAGDVEEAFEEDEEDEAFEEDEPLGGEPAEAEPRDEVEVTAVHGAEEQPLEAAAAGSGELAAPDQGAPVEAPTTALEVPGPAGAAAGEVEVVTAPPADGDETQDADESASSDADLGSRRVTGGTGRGATHESHAEPEPLADVPAVQPSYPPGPAEDGAALASDEAVGNVSPGAKAAAQPSRAARATVPQPAPESRAATRSATAKAHAAKPATPKPGTPKSGTPKSATSRPATPKPVASKAVAPKAVVPKAVAPKAVAPKAVAPKAVAPKPAGTGAPAARAGSAQPPANRAALAKAAASRAALAKSAAAKSAAGRPAERSAPTSPAAPASTDTVPGQTSSKGLPVRPPSAAARAVAARAVAARTAASRAAAARMAGRPEAAPGSRQSGAAQARATQAHPTGSPSTGSPSTGSPSTGSATPRPTGTGSRKVSAKAPSRPVVPPLDLTAPRPSAAPRPTPGRAPADQAAAGGTVVVIPDRGRFHRADCRYVRGQAGTEVVGRDAAVQQGYQPCGVCQP